MFVDVGAHRLAYEIEGGDDAPVVLLGHSDFLASV